MEDIPREHQGLLGATRAQEGRFSLKLSKGAAVFLWGQPSSVALS